MFLVLKFGKSPIDIQWSFLVYIIFSDLLFQLVQIKNKGKLSLKGGMTWIAVTLFLIYCILYYTALYYILSLSMNSISEFLPSTWELRLLSTSSLLSLFLEVLGSDLEPSMLRKCSIPELHPSSFFAAFLARVLWAVLPFSLCHFISLVHSSAGLRRWISFCNRLLCLSPLPQAFISSLWETFGKQLEGLRCWLWRL